MMLEEIIRCDVVVEFKFVVDLLLFTTYQTLIERIQV